MQLPFVSLQISFECFLDNFYRMTEPINRSGVDEIKLTSIAVLIVRIDSSSSEPPLPAANCLNSEANLADLNVVAAQFCIFETFLIHVLFPYLLHICCHETSPLHKKQH